MAAGLMRCLFISFLTLTTGLCATVESEFPARSNITVQRGSTRLRPRLSYPPTNAITTTEPTSPSEVPDACNTTYDAISLIRNEIFIFKDKYFWRIGASGRYDGYPVQIRKLWPGLPTDLTHIDTVYERPDGRIAFFIGKQLYLFESLNLLPGYPKQLSSLGLPESLEKLDAAMVWGHNDKTYFYSGTEFWRFDEGEGRVELDYPRNMAMWKGVGYDIDSVFTWKDGKTYFFKGKGFWKFNNLRMQVENDKPSPSAQFWMGCPVDQTSTFVTESPSSTTTAKDDSSVTARIHNNCILPQFSPHVTYTTNVPDSKPGDAFDIVALNVTCKKNYVITGSNMVFCYNGHWSSPIPQCVPQCRLPPHSSVEYHCLVSLDYMDGFRACKEYEPAGTQVRPSCRTHYYSSTTLRYMHCFDGEWSNIQKCTPECGTLIPNGTQLVLGGETAKLGEVPWHAGIYTKTAQPYKQICGGTLISTNTVISAAHCFWNNLVGKMPASNYAVAVGKLYRSWDSTLDKPQWSDVESVHLPVRFRGSATSYQDDIAVVVLHTAVEYNTYIRPVCLDFDFRFERRQLQPNNKGKAAGWGLTAENGNSSQVLRVVDLPYVPIETCIDNIPASFTSYITSDKICAGFNNASAALCKGDSGGGLAFPELDRGTLRYYLRGVTSTAPTSDQLCNANTYISFTRLISHEQFITRFWED